MPRDGKTNRSDSAAILELDELKHLFDELDDLYRAIAQLCYLIAGRIGEVLSLKADHLRGGGCGVPWSQHKDRRNQASHHD